MDEERRRILKMLAQGTISVDECAELLQALADSRERRDESEQLQATVSKRPKWPYVLLIVLFGAMVFRFFTMGLKGLTLLTVPLLGVAGFPTNPLALLLLIFWLWMLIDCLNRGQYDFRLLFTQNRQHEKLIWIGIVFLAGWAGALIYFLVIRQPARSIAPSQVPLRQAAPTAGIDTTYTPGPRARSLTWLVVVIPLFLVLIWSLPWMFEAAGKRMPEFHELLGLAPGLGRNLERLPWLALSGIVSLLVLAVFGTFFWIVMLISCLARDYRDFGTLVPSDPAADKLLWLFIILFTWVIGAIAYHISIRRRIRQPNAATGLGRATVTIGIVVLVLALLSVAVLLTLAAVIMPALVRARTAGRIAIEISNLHQLQSAAISYCSTHEGKLPAADSFPELLKPYLGGETVAAKVLASPFAPEKGRAYSMNAQLSEQRLDAIKDPQTVLFFESEFGSPPGGGQVNLPATPRGGRGYVVAFVGGGVKTVPKERLGGLLWQP